MIEIIYHRLLVGFRNGQFRQNYGNEYQDMHHSSYSHFNPLSGSDPNNWHNLRIHRGGGGNFGDYHCIDNAWKNLPIRTLHKRDLEILKKSKKTQKCSICMVEFKEGDRLRILPCFHEFHQDCIDQWFWQQNDNNRQASCPLDRKRIQQ